MKNLVVKDNALIEASYKLSLVEQRLILMAIVEMRKPLDYQNKPNEIVIYASDYAKHFETHINTAYQALQDATKDLMARQFTFIDTVNGKKVKKTSRWVSEIGYGVNEAMVTMKFAPAIMPLISELERRFTSYSLDRIAPLNSAYSVRLYELLIQWRSTGKTPVIKIEELRQKLGLEQSEYPRMTDFKKRVLDLAVSQISEHTDISATYKQIKKGRDIIGFEFAFKEKIKPKQALERDPNTIDMLTGVTDNESQLLSSKQADFFASKLAENSGFGSKFASNGEQMKAFTSRISNELQRDISKIAVYMPYLLKAGYTKK